jgi:hypothetical protein
MDQDRVKLLTDAAKVGALNLLIMYMAQKIYPNNYLLQAFVSGSVFHLSMQMLEFQ